MDLMGLVASVPSKTRIIAGAAVAVFVVMVSVALYGFGVDGVRSAQIGAVGLLCSLITMVTMQRKRMRGTLICLAAGAILIGSMQFVMG